MKKERKVWALTLLAFWWLSPNQTIAQQDSVRQLNEITITATRSEQPVIDVPRSVTVINRREIEGMQYNSVGELLSNHPGIYVVGATQVPGTNQSLFMRGANSNQVVVLIDGTRITDPSSPGSAVDLAELSLTGIERIEIIRGSHSTLFGGSAIGGAINIITSKGNTPGFHGSLNSQAGTLGKGSFIHSQNLGLNYTFKNGFYVNGSIFNQRLTGFNTTVDTITSPDVYKTTDDDNFRKTDNFIKAGYMRGPWDISLSFKNVYQHAEIDGGAFNDDDNAYVKFKRNLFDYHIKNKLNNNWTISFLGSWSDSDRRNLNDSSVMSSSGDYDATYVDSHYFGELLTNELIARYNSKSFNITVGAGQFREQMHFNSYYFSNSFGSPYESTINYDSIDIKAQTGYLFTQIQYEHKNFAVTAGSRWSNHSRFGNNLTFEVSPSYRIGDMLLYASVSSGFNAPSLYQLFDPTKDFGAFTTRGNSRLKPEKSVSMETGIKKEFRYGSYLTFSAFRSTTRSAIEYVYLWNGTTPVSDLAYPDYLGDTYLNVSNQVINGVELSGHLVVGKFFLKGNVTWLDGEVNFSPTDVDANLTGGNYVQLYNYGSFVNAETETKKLIRKPRVTGFAEVGFKPVGGVVITSTLRHAGARFDVVYDPDLGPFGALGRSDVRDYTLVDLGTTWQITKALLLGGKVENVFNESYREILGFQTRGRSGYVKVLYKW